MSLPAATTIGADAFYGCTALETVSLPTATGIGTGAFISTGAKALTVTLGVAAPSLGTNLFHNVSAAKAVTVKVPSGATGYGELPGTYTGTDTTDNWGNGFRGGGWDGSNMTDSSTVNSNISLTIETAP